MSGMHKFFSIYQLTAGKDCISNRCWCLKELGTGIYSGNIDSLARRKDLITINKKYTKLTASELAKSYFDFAECYNEPDAGSIYLRVLEN